MDPEKTAAFSDRKSRTQLQRQVLKLSVENLWTGVCDIMVLIADVKSTKSKWMYKFLLSRWVRAV